MGSRTGFSPGSRRGSGLRTPATLPSPEGPHRRARCSRFRRAVSAPVNRGRYENAGDEHIDLRQDLPRARRDSPAITELLGNVQLRDSRSRRPNCPSGVEASAVDRLRRTRQPTAGTGPARGAALGRLSGPPHPGRACRGTDPREPQRPQDGSPGRTPGLRCPRALLTLLGTDWFPAKRIPGRRCRLKRGSVCCPRRSCASRQVFQSGPQRQGDPRTKTQPVLPVWTGFITLSGTTCLEGRLVASTRQEAETRDGK